MGILCLLATATSFAQRKGLQSNYLEKTKSALEIRQIENKMERLYYALCGEFTNKRNAAATDDPTLAIEQELIAVPIWTERKNEHWIYVGWFKHGQPERALAQGVFRLIKESRDTFRLVQYNLPQPEANNYYSLEWKKLHPFRDLKPKDLVLPEGCDNLIVEESPNVFHVLSDENPCANSISDVIHYYDYECVYTPEAITNLTRYFDKDKNFIFGYNLPKGVEFVRIDKMFPTYGIPEKKQAKNK